MSIFDILGWAAVALTLCTYSQKTMVPLRISAICANLCFIGWSLGIGIPQTFALHLTLLPFNLYRLSEILRMKRRARQALAGDASPLDWLRPVMKPTVYEAGSYVFRLGDPVDHLYYVASGEVVMEEIGKVFRKGAMFGEIAFFTNARVRTASARCSSRCEIMAVDGGDFVKLYSQHPALSVLICRTIANRLLEGPRLPSDLHEQVVQVTPQPSARP